MAAGLSHNPSVRCCPEDTGKGSANAVQVREAAPLDVGQPATDGKEVVRRDKAHQAQKGTIMPNVGGKKYPYTKAGMKAASKARSKMTSGTKKKATKRGK